MDTKFATVTQNDRRSYEIINRSSQEIEPTFFDDSNKRDLFDKFVNAKPYHDIHTEDRAYLDEPGSLGGVKTYNQLRKNANSVDTYHIVSNLSNE